MGFKDLEGQLVRWLEILGTYDYEVVYRPGNRHGNADALSRRPFRSDECAFCDRIESRHDPEENSFCAAVTRGAKRNITSETERFCEGDDSWLDEMTTADLRKEQRNDPTLSHVITWLESSREPPPWEQVSSLSLSRSQEVLGAN